MDLANQVAAVLENHWNKTPGVCVCIDLCEIPEIAQALQYRKEICRFASIAAQGHA